MSGASVLRAPRDSLGHILHKDGLQPCQAAPEEGIRGKAPQKLNDGIEKSIVLPEHHGWANDGGIGKGGPDRQLPFTPVADIRGAGVRIGSDPRDMDEPFNARTLRLACDLPGCFHMQRLEGLGSAFAIEADGIHPAIGTGDRCSNRAFVSNIRT
jgi:hypothetical protein